VPPRPGPDNAAYDPATLGAAVLDNTTPALRRAWHVVATSDEVTKDPKQVWLLGTPWCLVRLDGRVTAYLDRCPHRLAPLSAGVVITGAGGRDELRCGYHGWSFDETGRCTGIPAVRTPPPARAAAGGAWGVEERYGLVWLAPEQPMADRHDFPEWDAAGFDRGLCEIVRTRAGAALLVDNFLDAAHFPFVHAATFGVQEAAEVTDSGITRAGWTVATTFSTWYREGGLVQPQDLRKVGSASLSIYLRLDFPRTGATIAILFCCTPEQQGTTRVYKAVARNDIEGDASRLAAFIAEEDQILREDLTILERYDHGSVPLDRTVEVHTRADRLSLGWRALMADFLSGDPGPAPTPSTAITVPAA
jgi:phenylpropionate dioxygenase-like ring-hydroxylating dioxygenase large terminal subunit